MKSIRWTVFVVMVIAQLAVPAYMIAGRERVLHEGTAYKFRCGPVDPYDAFRGRYVALSFVDNQVENWKGPYFAHGAQVFVQVASDDDGFAQIADVTAQRPGAGIDYLEATVRNSSSSGGTLWVRFPFDRYYMDEFQAPAAEAAYREQRRTQEGAHVVVRIRDGVGVLDGLFFGDISVEDYLRQVEEKEE
jgi:uncharacterized membrane-anchored protein